MKILLLGENGQLGRELSRSLLSLGELTALNRQQCDLSNPEVIPKVVGEIKPDIIVNAAAYTTVDKAEEEEEKATVVNGTAVAVLAEQAKRHHALLVHYSTDYVFDGIKSTPYIEEDSPNPINAYGRSKLLGEQAIQEHAGQYLIFRTSWIFSSRGANFIRTMLRLAQENDELRVIVDQLGSPTSAELIADITAKVLQQIITHSKEEPISELYHLTAGGETSWYGFARQLVTTAIKLGDKLKVSPEKILPIKSEDYVVAARRPLNSRLDTSKLRADYEISLPQWEYHVDQTVSEIVLSNTQ